MFHNKNNDIHKKNKHKIRNLLYPIFMIKKIIVAVFVAATFVIYSLHQRNEGANAVNSVSKQTTPTTPSSSPPSSSSQPSSSAAPQYKDGTYTGSEADAFYGYIQVRATVASGKLTDVTFLQYPNDRRDSVQINTYAMPQLKQQAIAAQSAQVDGVSGATDTSQAFIQSLGSALSQAKL